MLFVLVQTAMVLSGQKSIATEIIYVVVSRKPYGGSINQPVTSTLCIHTLAFLPHKRMTSPPFKCIAVTCERERKIATAVKTGVSLL
ncbi:hypothetical protein TNCV_2918341 [Trichonephila clavipes]|nr:hypothetical protein TNCV_2918341 [Trichonephila clavipes]